jgi:hypothetical protein
MSRRTIVTMPGDDIDNIITNITRGAELRAVPFTGIRLEIYRRGGLLRS